MTTYHETGDKIKGYKILCEARQIKPPKVIPKTGRHKAQRTILKDNAEATILAKVKYIGD
ncbi:MAG: hypothetical protein IJQ68_07045 [Methanobrevibacter sp.]|uniref:hypothetical protein n=1 Tax=Methanobrevibacter sp. TaxID=66852 RepID=UPI0025EED6AB|nr:hypothetical protein [Methanobrevibacter sp.]MBQ9025778.1 hypothetical protein [Methanobrevibacter sp.]MBR0271728.1 hypothetical protein [Methanobrevibacter sp.]